MELLMPALFGWQQIDYWLRMPSGGIARCSAGSRWLARNEKRFAQPFAGLWLRRAAAREA